MLMTRAGSSGVPEALSSGNNSRIKVKGPCTLTAMMSGHARSGKDSSGAPQVFPASVTRATLPSRSNSVFTGFCMLAKRLAGDRDLAESMGAIEVRQSVRGGIEAKGAIDDWPQAMLFDEGQHGSILRQVADVRSQQGD